MSLNFKFLLTPSNCKSQIEKLRDFLYDLFDDPKRRTENNLMLIAYWDLKTRYPFVEEVTTPRLQVKIEGGLRQYVKVSIDDNPPESAEEWDYNFREFHN